MPGRDKGKPSKADINLLMRALSVARGMVSPSYVAGEAKARAKMKKAGGGKAMKKKKMMAKGGAMGGKKKMSKGGAMGGRRVMMSKGAAVGGLTMAKVNAFLKERKMKAVKVK